MSNRQSSYAAWSWTVALALAIILLWLLITGKGFNNGCCHSKTATATESMMESDAAKTAPVEEAPIVVEAFDFTVSADGFSSSGDGSDIAWLSNIDELKALLGSSYKVAGDDISVTLTGTATSEADKHQKGIEAQAFFGEDVAVANNITVSEVSVNIPPPTAKVFFDSGYHRLPTDGLSILEPTIAFLKDNPEKKAIISGFHDATGVLANNQALAKKRAQSVYDVLIAANISANNIEMRKPVSADGGGDLNEARRVEISIE